MRKLCVALCLILLLACATALAEESAPDAELAALLSATHPDCTVAAFDSWGDTASAMLTGGGRNILCIAERRNGAWTLAADAPNALWQGDEIPRLLQDTDTVLFWTYHQDGVTTTYSVYRLTDAWGPVSVMRREAQNDGENLETEVRWDNVHGGTLWCCKYRCDENDNILDTSNSTPLPAKWLADDMSSLAAFDASKVPAFDETEHEYAWQDLLEKAAAELLPGDTFIRGTLGWDGDGIELFMQKPDGARVMVGCIYDGETPDGWVLTTSTPLPAGTEYGYENFSSSLYIGERLLADIGPQANGGWGVNYVMSWALGEVYYLTESSIADEAWYPKRIAYGAHPWSDITTIDWNSIPNFIDEAIAAIDCTGWAVVNNPNRADRLHLRAEPNQSAASLGKYYNGTPARVLERQGDWAHVSVFGVEGWMMARYLAFDKQAEDVTPAFPHLEALRRDVKLLDGMADGAVVERLHKNQEMHLLGIVGEEWYHVWLCGTDLTGYVRQEDVTATADLHG